MTILFGAFFLGVVAGMRTLTAPAAIVLARRPGVVGIILAVLALGEYVGDLLPQTPMRTAPFPLIARVVSGGFCGWATLAWTGSSVSPIVGGLCGVAGALLGAYGGVAVRLRTIAATGAVPAAILEDVVAALLAIVVVERI